jgi:hypothetical protein
MNQQLTTSAITGVVAIIVTLITVTLTPLGTFLLSDRVYRNNIAVAIINSQKSVDEICDKLDLIISTKLLKDTDVVFPAKCPSSSKK